MKTPGNAPAKTHGSKRKVEQISRRNDGYDDRHYGRNKAEHSYPPKNRILQVQNYPTAPVEKIDDQMFEPVMAKITRKKAIEEGLIESVEKILEGSREADQSTYPKRLQNLFYRLAHELNQKV